MQEPVLKQMPITTEQIFCLDLSPVDVGHLPFIGDKILNCIPKMFYHSAT